MTGANASREARSVAGSKRIHLTAAGVLVALLALAGPAARAHPEGPGVIESYLHGLAEDGAITEAQQRPHSTSGNRPQLVVTYQ